MAEGRYGTTWEGRGTVSWNRGQEGAGQKKMGAGCLKGGDAVSDLRHDGRPRNFAPGRLRISRKCCSRSEA